MKETNIKIGEVFELDSRSLRVTLHYVYDDPRIGQLVRVFNSVPSPTGIPELESATEAFLIFFPLEMAVKKGVVRPLGSAKIPGDFEKPKFMRSKYTVRGEFCGWHIVDTETWVRHLVKSLSEDERNLSPWGVWNSELLISRLSEGWSLEKWV